MDQLEINPTLDPQSHTGFFIPGDVQECFVELDKMLPTNVRENLRANPDESLTSEHFGLGLWMRNNWGLWSGKSRLKQHFDGLGIQNADSISSIILSSYWRYLNGKPLELPRQIVYDKIARDEIKTGPKPSNETVLVAFQYLGIVNSFFSPADRFAFHLLQAGTPPDKLDFSQKTCHIT